MRFGGKGEATVFRKKMFWSKTLDAQGHFIFTLGRLDICFVAQTPHCLFAA